VKLQDYRDDSYAFSGKASDLNRQLGFAGIALIWLFKSDVGGHATIPTILIVAGALIVVSLTLDMLHYLIGWWTWRSFYLKKEDENVSEHADLSHDVGLEERITRFFLAKIAFVVAAYVLIFIFLIKTLTT
jgi:hypothetical protein